MTELMMDRGVSPSRRREASGREVLLIVCSGVILASLDLFIVNVALPQIAHDLGETDLSRLSWVLNGYAVVYAALLVFFGRLADRYRRDLGFLLGVAVFTLASAACAAATTVDMLIGFRLVQAAGAALVTPTSLGLVLAAHEPERRQGAVRTWTAVGGMSAAIGPVVGGLLVAASWRWAFLVNVPVGLAALVVGWRRLPRLAGQPTERPDAVGVLLATGGVGLLTAGLVRGPDWGWSSAALVGSLAGGVGLLVLFAVHCATSRNPLVHPSLFTSRHFTGASVVALFFSASFGAMLLSIVLWEQGQWGWSALQAGLAMAPGPLMVPLVSFGITGRLIARYGPASVIGLGSVIFGGGVAWWALAITTEPDYVSGVLGGMTLTGIGVGLTLPTMMSTAAASLPPQSFATGSAVVNMVRQTGIALGVAVTIAVLGESSVASGIPLHLFTRVWWVTAALSVAGIVPAVALLRRPARAA
ncbi:MULTISPECIES: MFS transporter [unclassified Parafrankia]|uniref:MFS transporter n=1 Tax=unclassified Parafrankia TaxID=2994368 RepID=UPI000DA564E6|nr:MULTISPECIES: MFS transporter [unclassified Parafrankia]TCJ35001.1 MFS transporter [Parafrankia sp. BMG5.11]SQD97293.1 Major facilitator superfamily MFS_1 [Parafrankia sp. Ea1.12]